MQMKEMCVLDRILERRSDRRVAHASCPLHIPRGQCLRRRHNERYPVKRGRHLDGNSPIINQYMTLQKEKKKKNSLIALA